MLKSINVFLTNKIIKVKNIKREYYTFFLEKGCRIFEKNKKIKKL